MSTAAEQAIESKLQILFEASATLIGALRTEELLPKVLELARKLNAAQACAIWRQDPETQEWRIASATGLSSAYLDVAISGDGGFNIAERPFCFEDLAEVASVPQASQRRGLYEAEGIRSLVAMPMNIGGRLCGTLAFYYHERHHFTETELRVAAALTSLAASAVETAELYAQQEEARVRSAFLAEASAVLASSLDYSATLAAVARLAVQQIADWCVVDMAQPGGGLQRLAVAHNDPSKIALSEELSRKYPYDPQAAGGPAAVLRTGRPDFLSHITPGMLESGSRSPEHRDLLLSLGLASYMCVPLIARDRVMGAMTFVSTTAGRRYGPVDLAFAEDLARRAAMAIDNAMLYAAAQRERTALEAVLGALRENEERLLLAMDAGRLGIWDWNLQNGELEWSDNSAAMAAGLGMTFEALVEAVHPDDRDGFLECVDRAIVQKAYFECEFRVPAADGGLRWMASKGKVFCDTEGKPSRMIGIAMDITERRSLEEKLRGAQKLESIGLLAGGIAHDFNNLLTGILGNASLALELMPADATTGALLENVVQASERAADLTQQLLAYSGKGRFVVEPIDLSALAREITDLLQATIPKMVTLRLELAENLPAVEADSSQVQQVIMNLVINAAEAIGERSGTVVVKTGLRQVSAPKLRQPGFAEDLKVGRYVCLEVRDDGCGMDEATASRIFDPFFTTKFTGRGLGLAAVSGIVRGHHGAIQVKSAVGQGSTFEVLFPATAASAPAPEEPDKGEDLTGSGLVLVIDDEAAVRTTASAALRRYGYRVEMADDGAAGVEAFRRRPLEFVAVLLDLTMPVMGGERALALIKEIRPQVPVIASSGYSEAEALRRFPAGEFAAFLQKPYTAATLARMLKAIVPRDVAHRTNPA
jgi:PAS domain S-box-containing protein